jgi:NTP pyrophosphatase (non-canonical NTP hydrolase)
MKNYVYRDEALKTESINFYEIIKRLKEPRMLRILHTAMGICTEAGELLDAVKRHIFYGKELDEVNLKEEIGDLGWYEEVLMDVLGVVREGVQKVNAEKLAKRYKNGFSKEEAYDRDLVEERKVLEEGKDGTK